MPASLRDAFGFPSQYVGQLDSITDGYWVAVEGLNPGPHTLLFGGTIPELAPGNAPFTLEVTDTLNVVPEPGVLSLLLLGTVAAYGRRRSGPGDAVSGRNEGGKTA
ncbi:MAG TPA: PEP-CTERM sorting domain-containing protein [Methylococcales bacterium]